MEAKKPSNVTTSPHEDKAYTFEEIRGEFLADSSAHQPLWRVEEPFHGACISDMLYYNSYQKN